MDIQAGPGPVARTRELAAEILPRPTRSSARGKVHSRSARGLSIDAGKLA